MAHRYFDKFDLEVLKKWVRDKIHAEIRPIPKEDIEDAFNKVMYEREDE